MQSNLFLYIINKKLPENPGGKKEPMYFLPVLKRNALRFFQSVLVFGVIYMILELFGITLYSQEYALIFALIGYAMTYVNIYIGTVMPIFLSLKDNDLIVKLFQIFQLASPFLGLSTASNFGYNASTIYCIIFVSVVVVIRWNAVKKHLFGILGIQ